MEFGFMDIKKAGNNVPAHKSLNQPWNVMVMKKSSVFQKKVWL